jgi:hypothetical protein
MCVSILWNISHSKKIQQAIVINVHRSSCKVPVFLTQSWILLTDFLQYWNTKFYENLLGGAELFHADTQRGRMKLIVIVCDFEKAPE